MTCEQMLKDFDYELPEALIAKHALADRSASRLMLVTEKKQLHKHFTDIIDEVNSGDLLVFNDTRVIHARLLGKKTSGGAIEVFIERVINNQQVLALVRASKTPRPGSRLLITTGFEFVVEEKRDELYLLTAVGSAPVLQLIEQHGKLPLPPYINRQAEDADEARYQTVYARHQGSVAAPTAGLHFDNALIKALAQKGVRQAFLTLHVGAGTFLPVRSENLAEHKMHSEYYQLPKATVSAIAQTQDSGGKVIAVGTTSLRTLEAAAQYGSLQAGSGETDIFIRPGFQFKVVDRLLTNFHLPKSTLLMLVSAFAGSANIRAAYDSAIAEQYRFFSYGDAMLLTGINKL